MMNKKDDYLSQYKTESTKFFDQYSEKQRENGLLKKQIVSLEEEIYKLNQALSIYNDSDHRLLDFKGGFAHQSYESPFNAKKTSLPDKDL